MILSILKIIGIILLIIIAVFIFIVSLVLFVPIRYRFEGSYQEILDGEGYVRWAPVFLKVSANVKNNRLEYVIKIFGGVIMTNTDAELSWLGRKFFSFEEERNTHSDQNAPLKDEKVMEMPLDEINTEEDIMKREHGREAVKKDAKAIISENDSKNTKKTGNISKNKHKTAKKASKMPSEDRTQMKNQLFIFKKLGRLLNKWKIRWKNFRKRLKEIGSKKDALLKIYHSKRFEMAKQDIKLYLQEIFSIVKPDRLEGYLHFGLEDPSLTGQILGIIAMLLPVYQGFLSIKPDFTKSCLDGTLKGKGKIFPFSIVKLAFKVILNKNLIKVTKKVQTILEA